MQYCAVLWISIILEAVSDPPESVKSDPDPHHYEKPDPDPHQSEKLAYPGVVECGGSQ
jgi:hypothetical protein